MAEMINLVYSKNTEYYMNSIYHAEEAPVTPPQPEGIVYDGAGVEGNDVDIVYDGGEP